MTATLSNMKKKLRFGPVLGAAFVAVVAVVGVSGCEDDDTGTVATSANCDDVCDQYRACFNPSYDVAACTNRCVAQVGNKTILSTDVDDCLDCIGDNMCSPAYSCTGACDTIIVTQ